MKLHTLLALVLAAAMFCVPVIAAQQSGTSGQDDGPMTENPRYNKSQTPSNTAPPRSDDDSGNVSSSNQTRIDLSPPKEDQLAHPDESSGIMEVHEWNPLRAMKDIEVGDFYYNEGNYKAALSRYREALQYKPRDAAATFKLAQALEKDKEFEEARVRYQEYLTILKDGPRAKDAQKALERLNKRSSEHR